MKKAIIVGCHGQDGRLLDDFLSRKKFEVIGIDKKFIKCPQGMNCGVVDINKPEDVNGLIRDFEPDEVYYLAALHHSSQADLGDHVDLFRKSFDIHVLAFMNFLEAIKQHSPRTRILYAASSHIFGNPENKTQDENTAIRPNCIYGITKAAGLFVSRLYRKNYSIFAPTCILYNHESSFRHEDFVSKKIISGAVRIKKKEQERLLVGDLDAEIDWGYAPDFIDGMHRIINHGTADDFIVATGKRHTVRDFVKIAFEYLDLDWSRYVEEDRSIITKQSYRRIGNPRKLMKATGWKPTVDFKGMIRLLLTEEGAFVDDRNE